MRNAHIRAKLGIVFISDEIDERKRQWTEYVYRMEDQRLVKRTVDYKPVGKICGYALEEMVAAKTDQVISV